MNVISDTLNGRPIRGLTLIRPWPWAFTHADKRIENRGWKPSAWMLGGWVALHAGRKFDRDAAAAMAGRRYGPIAQACPQERDAHPSGVIVAVAAIEGFFKLDDVDPSEVDGPLWCFGPYCWRFVPNAINVLREPVPAQGSLGLWKLPPAALEAIKAQWDQRRPPCVDVDGQIYSHVREALGMIAHG